MEVPLRDQKEILTWPMASLYFCLDYFFSGKNKVFKLSISWSEMAE